MLARVEERLAAQRKEIQAAINAIANSIALLSGQAVPATGGRSVVLPSYPPYTMFNAQVGGELLQSEQN
jgi:hypothetical protein